MTSSNAQAWHTKHILLNNLGSKHSLVVKFYPVYVILKKFMKNVAWKLVPDPF